MSEFSHIDKDNRPTMVDVGGKAVTRRTASAQAVVVLPEEVLKPLEAGEFAVKKGPVFETAILAGIQAAKKTSDLIPLCHPLGLDDCHVHIELNERNEVVIQAHCALEHKTGVEMEALTAVSVAALTIYDMCKGLSHNITIRDIRLLEKSGGRRDYKA